MGINLVEVAVLIAELKLMGSEWKQAKAFGLDWKTELKGGEEVIRIILLKLPLSDTKRSGYNC